jgi:ribonuclease D
MTPEIITQQKPLEALCRDLRAARRFAFDTEFIRDETYNAALCLVQVAFGDQVALVDPTGDVDLAPFWALVTDPGVVTIVHAGKEDFEVCLRATGNAPHNVFDVQIAAGFVGHGYPLSLSRLVSTVVGRRIAKGQTMTDWLRRPLTTEQLRYAVEDVAYLPAIYEQLTSELKRTRREDWAREEFLRFEAAGFYRSRTPARLIKARGLRKLDSLGLALLDCLINWREEWAAQKNRPTRALIRDDVLVEIARRRPKRSELEVMRGFPQSRNSKIIDQIVDLIDAASKTPAHERPPAHEPPEETPMIRSTLDLLSSVVRAICFENDVSHELVGGTQRLRELLEHLNGHAKPKPLILSGWRGELIGQRLLGLLEGRCEVHLSGWPNAPKLSVVAHRPRGANRTRAEPAG